MTAGVDVIRRFSMFVVRNRVKIFDLGFVLISLAVAGLLAFEVDIFVTEGSVTRRQETVELNELLALTALVLFGALFYTWRRAREHQRENDRRLEAEREVLSLAMHDPLTGLPNRRKFDEALRAALNTPPTAPEAHAVFMLDLNGFKKINDLHGHPTGDQVLAHVGARLMRAVRDGDLVARLGGDEFAVLARNLAGEEAATSIAMRIIEALEPPVVIGGARHSVGSAIGAALAPQDTLEREEIMRMADVALYRAKAEKVSALRFFEPEMDARLRERDALESALRAAVAGDTIDVRFKPSTDAATGAVTAFEAVPCWDHPDLGPLTADRFLPMAQESGLLTRLTDQLLRKAFVAAAQWPPSVRLAINVEAAQLKEATFGLRLLHSLAAADLAPNRVDLEIDEGALIRDAEVMQALLSPLRDAGVSIVADHFGTGYADLQNLHRLQLDRIKIDPSFVEAMLSDRRAAVMVKGLIGIAQGLNLTIMADGVSTEAQRQALASQGCQTFQDQSAGLPVDSMGALGMVESGRGRLTA